MKANKLPRGDGGRVRLPFGIRIERAKEADETVLKVRGLQGLRQDLAAWVGGGPLESRTRDRIRAGFDHGHTAGSAIWKRRLTEYIGQAVGMSASDAATLLDKYAGFAPADTSGWQEQDYSPQARAQHQKKVVRVVHESPLARRNLSDLVDFTLGTGVTWSSDDPAVNDHLGKVWDHPVNALQSNHRRMVESLFKDGELVVPIQEVRSSDRVVIFGAVVGGKVSRVVSDPENPLRDLAVVVRHPRDGRRRGGYRLLNNVEDPKPPDAKKPPEWWKTIRVSSEPVDFLGDAFYFAVNRVLDARHGKSFLLPALDYYDAHDETAFGMAERLRIANMVMWVVTIDSCQTPAQLIEYAKALGLMDATGALDPPVPGEVRLQGKGMSYQAVSPAIDMKASGDAEQVLRNTILSLHGIPEAVGSAWGGDANRATLFRQTGPMARRFAALQGVVAQMFRTLLNYSLDMAVGKVSGITTKNRRAYELVMQELASGEERGEIATTLQMTVAACALAVQEQFLDRGVGRFMVEKLVQDSGVDLQFVESAVEDEEESALPAAAPTVVDTDPIYMYDQLNAIVTIDEIRARKGLGPHPDRRLGPLTVPAARAKFPDMFALSAATELGRTETRDEQERKTERRRRALAGAVLGWRPRRRVSAASAGRKR